MRAEKTVTAAVTEKPAKPTTAEKNVEPPIGVKMTLLKPTGDAAEDARWLKKEVGELAEKMLREWTATPEYYNLLKSLEGDPDKEAKLKTAHEKKMGEFTAEAAKRVRIMTEEDRREDEERKRRKAS